MLLGRSIQTLDVLKIPTNSAFVKLLMVRAANTFKDAIGPHLRQKTLRVLQLHLLTIVNEILVPINPK
jgi:hypothetical protein